MTDARHLDDEPWQPGMPVLARQEVSGRVARPGRPLVPQRVPETRPTPLQGAFIGLSVMALICGTLAISALELGQPLSTPIVRLLALIGAALLLPVTADAAIRIARSVRAWWPVDRGRALFRLVWIGVLVISMGLEAAAAGLVLVG